MKRKLIDFDVFKKIETGSLSKAESELTESQDILSKILKTPGLKLHCFGESDATFSTLKGTYVHSNYALKENTLTLSNIEELVVDEQSEKKNARELISQMVDKILEDNTEKAKSLFGEYLSFPAFRRSIGTPVTNLKEKIERRGCIIKENVQRKSHLRHSIKNKKLIKECANLKNNVNGYLQFKKFGPVIKESVINRDEKGNVVSITVPTSKVRNEGKILSFNWKTLNTEVEVKRSAAKKMSEDNNFCRAMAELKRHNAISDNKALEECLDKIVVTWPKVIYLTQEELAQTISRSLEKTGATNYSDETCEFMAEGILRIAQNICKENVDKIMRLANVQYTNEDSYKDFQNATKELYSSMDDTTKVEMQLFSDLYDSLVEIYKIAQSHQNEALRIETGEYLKDLHSILSNESEPDLDLANSISEWLTSLVETNLETSDWTVSNNPHMTVSGDHPDMAKKAAQGYTPKSDFSGDWGDPAPVSDGKNYKGDLADEMRNRGWSNIGGSDVYPDLRNPYVPDGGMWTMKGEKGVDKNSDDGLGQVQGDTWPELQNVYCPTGVTPQNYKMKSDDLVVDK